MNSEIDTTIREAFTKVDNQVNLEVNNLEVDCITNANNKFSLDSDGNLIVNSITTSTSNNTQNEFNIDKVYPIGSIYMNVTSANPSNLFGGTWERIQGRFLLGANDSSPTYNAGKTGGSVNHSHSQGATGKATGNTGSTTLTVDQIPSHSHLLISYDSATGTNIWQSPTWQQAKTTYSQKNSTVATGGGKGHTHTLNNHTHTNPNTASSSNMPPFLAVYIWKRTA